MSRRWATVAWAGIAAVSAASCEREQRPFHVASPSAQPAPAATTQVSLHPGTTQPTTGPTTSPLVSVSIPHAEYEHNAWNLSEGKRLYAFMNCNGCHAHGGGDIGPPLMDAKWIYGYEPQQIHATIVEGRPNGMPSYRGRLADYQVWQLVAYVRSLSGIVPKDAAPGRNDDMKVKPPEHSKDPEQPRVVPPDPVTRPTSGPTTQEAQ